MVCLIGLNERSGWLHVAGADMLLFSLWDSDPEKVYSFPLWLGGTSLMKGRQFLMKDP